MKVVERARWLYRLVLVQKVTRTVLRAAWLGGAVYLICWGVNRLWGVMPNSGLWILFSVLAGFSTLLSLLVKPVSIEEFLWRVDHRFSQKEQISTAYQVSPEAAQAKEGEQSLARLLLADAVVLLPAIIRRVLDRGWKLRSDVEATLIVLMLLMTVYLSGMESFSSAIPGAGLGLLPGAGRDPTFLDVYGSGIPGDTSGNNSALQFQPAAGDTGPTTAENLGLTAEGLDLVYQVFREMGALLADNVVTADFGRSLEAGDFASAANELNSLAENVDRLSTDTRHGMAEAFSFGARELYLSEFAEITAPLSAAASALETGSQADMQTELDRVSSMLRSLIAEYSGVYAREEYDEPQPERVGGEGQPLQLETPEDVSDLLVAPGTSLAGTGEVLTDTVDLIGLSSTGSGVFSQPWYDYAWDEKNVVTKYFSPR